MIQLFKEDLLNALDVPSFGTDRATAVKNFISIAGFGDQSPAEQKILLKLGTLWEICHDQNAVARQRKATASASDQALPMPRLTAKQRLLLFKASYPGMDVRKASRPSVTYIGWVEQRVIQED